MSKESDLVCYCFNYTRKQIEDDYINNKRSTILETIVLKMKSIGCNCAEKNPSSH
ncbi:BFD-like (2Fe-2S) protein [Pelagibaculum spongiae]|uniref:BFD-like (2Fe-2S) protein n=1 Tax=Pelagibaculum spongiae TaxID=2080658 RepID=A0A2V1GZE9_9GAMM|nr:BFD-like (2Fe-2S) protein [Pelagibaculum spongiae]